MQEGGPLRSVVVIAVTLATITAATTLSSIWFDGNPDYQMKPASCKAEPGSPDCYYRSDNPRSDRPDGDRPNGRDPLPVYCDALDEITSEADCNLYERILANLREGTAGIVAPDRMELGETATVSLAIGREGGAAHVEELLGKAPTKAVTIRVARRMGAELVGDGFQVSPAGIVVRDLAGGGEQIWNWQVTALEAPRHELILSAYAVVQPPNGQPSTRLLRTLRHPMAVDVPWGHWLRRTVSDLTATLTTGKGFMVALLAFLGAAAAVWGFIIRPWKQRRKRANQAATAAKDGAGAESESPKTPEGGPGQT